MAEAPTVPHFVRTLPVQSVVIEVIRGPDTGKRFQAQNDTVTIGSSDANDLVLTDDTVSRYHLELRRQRDRILVEDHHSTNGTTYGGIQLERAMVPPGTTLILGKSSIRIEDGGTVELELHQTDGIGPLRGRTPEMRRLMASVERVARSDASVLLLGETGSGKEVVARAMHQASPRAEGPFETVDCASLMPTLVASELFGHEKGAFTGAEQRHLGAFERANGGTLFLDEIGELPANLQAALLGALERRSFRRVGGTSPVSVDVRVVSATHRDLRAEVNSGTFREDLYYRIGVILLRIPPLRDRLEDLPLLAEHFLRELGHDGALSEILSEQALDRLKKHRWPGNVRELRNFIEAALVLGDPPSLETRAAAPSAAGSAAEGTGFPVTPLSDLLGQPYKLARDALIEEFEAIYLKRLYQDTSGNTSEAARRSKLDRSYLVQLFRRHGIK